MRSVGATLVKLIATATSGFVSFTTNVIRPVKVTCEFSPVQAEGTPSPDNPLPISGWTGCEIVHTNDNLIFPPFIKTISRATISAGVITSSNYFDLLVVRVPRTSLYLHKNSSSSDTNFGFSNNPDLSKGDSIEHHVNFRWGNNYQYDNTEYDYAYITRPINATSGATYSISPVDFLDNVLYGTGQNIPITFTAPSTGDPMTVYGGTVTLNEDGSADLVVAKGAKTVGDLTWEATSTASVFRAIIPDKANRTASMKCDTYKTESVTVSIANMADMSIKANNNIGSPYREYVYIKDTNYSTPESFKAGRSDVKFIYDLYEIGDAIHFDNIGQLQSFLGTNNIWHNMNGDITVEYWNKQ